MKTYKILLMLITLMSFSSPLLSQHWSVEHSGLPDSPDPTLIFSAVDSNVCWGIQNQSALPSDILNPKLVLTTDGGNHWSLMEIQGITGMEALSIFAIDAVTAYITLDNPDSTGDGGIYKTTDGGLTWNRQPSAFPVSRNPRAIYFFDADNGLCTGNPLDGYWEIYTTANGGTNWTRVPQANIPDPDPGDFTGSGYKSGVGNYYWFGTSKCSVYKTSDRGLSWSVARNIFPDECYFNEVAFKDNLNGLSINFFGVDSSINRISSSTDGGVTWSSHPSPPSHPTFYFLSYVPGTSGEYFIMSQNNVGGAHPTVAGSAYTIDDGMTWVQVDSLAHGPSTFTSASNGWSGGRGDTIYKWTDSHTGIGDNNSHQQLNTTATLSQNYPNPFSSSTSIQYQIQSTSYVIIKVYDILGNEVTTLVNEEESAGIHEVNFKPRGLGNGIYYYRLQVGDLVQSKKLIIL